MLTAAAPEKAIAVSKILRVARGLNEISAAICIIFVANSQITSQIIGTPVFADDRKYSEDWNTEQIVVKHGVPVREPGSLDFSPHGQHLQIE